MQGDYPFHESLHFWSSFLDNRKVPEYSRNRQHAAYARSMRRKMTSAEVAVWSMVRGGRLGWRFRRQEPIGPYIVDFVCFSRRLVIEMDGDAHVPMDADRERDRFLQQRGFRVLRFWNNDLDHPASIEHQIKRWLDDPTLTEPDWLR